MSHWLEDVVMEGLEQLDVDEALQAQVQHFSKAGEWRKGVISPSLVAVQCPLARVKIFLGHGPVPGQAPRMAVRAGRKDAISLVNMVRGFDGEGLIIAALRKTSWQVIESAPTFSVEWTDPISGIAYAGHPDVMGLVANGYELIQIKTPSVFKMDRVEKYGDEDALKSYLPQMATEMFIARKQGLDVRANNLLMFSWEGTVKMSRPRVKVITLEWHESLASIPEQAAYEIMNDAAQAMVRNVWPEAYPQTSWDIYPCSYCRFARLGDFNIPACDNHEAWKSD